jgi:hypothetical protein
MITAPILLTFSWKILCAPSAASWASSASRDCPSIEPRA